MPFITRVRRHRVTARKHVPHHELKDLPRGIRLLAWARTIRWVGWGFGEALIPIFLFSFSASYAQAGLFSSILEIVSLLALPIVGMLADRVSAKVLILAGLLLYPFVGISYFLAGLTGIAFFVIAARVFNGVSWVLDGTGTDTYYRRMTVREHLASSFGYIQAFAHLGWIGAALAGILLVQFIPLHYLLLAIAPFSLFAIPLVLRAPKDKVHAAKTAAFSALSSYRSAVVEVGTWNVRMKLLGVLVLFMGVIETLIWFFIPIDAYIEGANLTMVILLAVVATVPTLSAYAIGRVADRRNKYLLIVIGLIGVAILMVGLALFPNYAFKLVASFLLGVLMEFFGIAGKFLVTVLGPEATYGSRGSAFESIATMGNIAAPLLIGISFDLIGFSGVALTIAVVAGILSVAFGILVRSRSLS